MKAITAALAVLLSAAAAHAQQTVLVPWDHTWAVMHPMGQMPDIPPGGDTDFDTTWFLKAADFAVQYNGPTFGGDLNGVAATQASYDSRLTKGPVGYDAAGYFTAAGAEFTGFGDNDGAATTAVSGRLTTPATGNRRAAYFRTTFTVPPGGGALINPRFRYLIDDGAYVYLDGELIMAINMAATTPANLDTYRSTPEVVASGTGNEGALSTISLGLAAGATTSVGGVNVRTIKSVNLLPEGEHTLALSVRNNAGFSSSDLVMALELSAEAGCSMSATTANVTRSDAGTPFNPNDDTFSFEATVTAFNAGTAWTSDDPAQASGVLDTPATFGPYPVSGGAKTVTFSSQTQPPCTAQVTVTPPGGSLTATAQSWTRHPQGTLDPTDDTFTANVFVTGQFVTNAWRVVSTTPAAAAGGTPVTGTTGASTTFGPYLTASSPVTVVVADAANPAITATVVLLPQSYIGSRNFGGITSQFLSAAPITPWTVTTGLNPVLTLSNVNTPVWREVRSPVFDLSSIGAVGFSMELVARETSNTTSNFEADDQFRAKLIVTDAAGTSEINLIAPYDTDANGVLNGSSDTPYDVNLDEFNLKREATTVTINNTLRMEAGIPATATAVQLVIEGSNVAGSEFFDVRKISFSDQCGFSATASSITRNLNGQPVNPAAHTAEFTLRAVPAGPVSAAGWDVTFNRLGTPLSGASVTSGAWNANVTVTGLPADGGPITAILKDKGDPTCLTALSITIPAAPLHVGRVLTGAAVTGQIFSNGPAAGWTATGTTAAPESEISAVTAIGDFSTVPLDLTAVSGSVAFSLTLEAEETSTTSNFEDPDIFLAELVLSDGTNTTTVNLITPYDDDARGTMNGSPTTVAYDPGADEFNTGAEAVSAQLKNTFVLTHTIPDNIVSATLHIRARSDASEFFRIKDAAFTLPGAPGNGDSDGDGVSDAQEALAGTDPQNAASVFRLATLSVNGSTVTAAFPTVNGKFYQGYTSTNLTTWTRDDSAAALAGNGNAATWNFGVTAGTPAKYYRVAVGAAAGAFPATLP